MKRIETSIPYVYFYEGKEKQLNIKLHKYYDHTSSLRKVSTVDLKSLWLTDLASLQ